MTLFVVRPPIPDDVRLVVIRDHDEDRMVVACEDSDLVPVVELLAGMVLCWRQVPDQPVRKALKDYTDDEVLELGRIDAGLEL